MHWLLLIVQAMFPRSSSVSFKWCDQMIEDIKIVSKTKAFMNKTPIKIRAALLLFCLSMLLRIEKAERNHPIKSAIKKRPAAIRYKYATHL